MLKALAVVRVVFLVFIVGFTALAMPWQLGLPANSTQGYDICRESLTRVSRAAWIAIAWIALDAVLSWWLAARASRRRPEQLPPVGPPAPTGR